MAKIYKFCKLCKIGETFYHLVGVLRFFLVFLNLKVVKSRPLTPILKTLLSKKIITINSLKIYFYSVKNDIFYTFKKANHKIGSIYNIFMIYVKKMPNRVFIWPFFALFSVLNACFLCPYCNILY